MRVVDEKIFNVVEVILVPNFTKQCLADLVVPAYLHGLFFEYKEQYYTRAVISKIMPIKSCYVVC